MDKGRLHPMRVVTRRTGLKPDLIRAWERRYGAIRPARSQGSRRLYSDDDIRRLTLLQNAVAAGHRISEVASLPDSDLEGIGHPSSALSDELEAQGSAEFQSGFLDDLVASVQKMDEHNLTYTLEKAAFSLGQVAFIDRLVMPLLEKLGELWAAGTLRVYHEHLVSAAVRSLFGRLLLGATNEDAAPMLLAGTPTRQLHELGALGAALMAASEGWRVIYLGPNLPAEEILAAAQSHSARAVALSVIYPGDDPRLADELKLLGRHLPSQTRLLVGGRAGAGYSLVLESIGGKYLRTMPELREELRVLRQAGDS